MVKAIAIVCAAVMLTGCEEQRITALTPDASRPRLTEYTAAVAGAPFYLDALNSSTYIIAHGINDAGTIVGESGAGVTAVLWDTGINTGPTSTSPVVIGTQGYAHDVNSYGQVVGVSFASGPSEAVLWTPMGGGSYAKTSVGLPGSLISAAYGINDKGQVVGTSRIASGSSWVDKCFLWTPTSDNGTTGSVQELPGFGGTFCVANDLNLAGQVTGMSNAPGDPAGHAFVWSGGVTYTLQPATDQTYGTAINNGGQVAGFHLVGGNYRAAVWTPIAGGWSSANDISVPALSGQTGSIGSYALDINDAGFIVGYTNDANGLERGFFWNAGAILELGDSNAGTVEPVALTNVVGNRVIVAGAGLAANSPDRHAMRWTVSLTPIVTEGCSDRLVRLIGELKAGGVINNGVSTSLLSKVDGSARQAAAGKTTPARNILYALIEEVDGMRSSGRLNADQAAALRDAALCVIAGL